MGYRSLAVLISRYPRFIILCWVFVIGMSAVWAWKLPGIVQDHGLNWNHGDAHAVELILEKEFHVPADPVILLFEKKNGTTPAEFRGWIKDRLQQARTLSSVTSIISPLEARGSRMLRGDVAYALLAFDVPPYKMGEPLEQLRSVLRTDDKGTIRITGKSVVQQDVNRLSFRDLERAEVVGLPLAFIILCFAFRGLYAALIAVIMGVSGVITAMGVTSLMGYHLALSNFVINVIPMVGMALSTDFALIILSRYREELQQGQNSEEPGLGDEEVLQRMLRTAGRAVFFSVACVLLGLLGLLWIRLPMFLSVSLGAIIVLIISVLLNITLLPAILSLFSKRIFRQHSGRSFSSKQGQHQQSLPSRSIWAFWSGMIMKRPVRMALLGTGTLLIFVLPVTRLELAIPDASSLPDRMESRQATEQIQSVFGQKNVSAVEIVIGGTSEPLTSYHWRMALSKMRELQQDSNVVAVESAWGIMLPDKLSGQAHIKPQMNIPSPSLREALKETTSQQPAWQRSYVSDYSIRMVATIHGAPGSDEAASWLEQMRAKGNANSNPFVPLRYGGEAVMQHEIMQEISGQLPKVLVFVVVSNYLVLLVAFRSLLIPIKAILMNLLSLAASFGVLVLVFNQGHLGMEPSAIAIMIPVFIAGLVFGISMDYGVFMLTRIQEVYRRTRDSDLAVQQGLASTGRLITSAAAILLAVTVPFAFADVAGVKQLGIGITAAVFIDVTMIRLVLVPALMKLMGRWNWWLPGHRE
ncbi:MMPL family transporter [Paenibacillus sp. OK076]|uniref:MMPL family transporter n=1 Tax=Paenibacillus sp. OK076 TaxID=1884379 RepID=UPI0008C5599D|nr:MMPL family transporter [Paenibacillus sp. OK076]SEN40401.1 putative drug exporter of the RND superfamily [Paenibacillus sp. OK076]